MYIFSMSKKKKGFHVSAEIFEKQWHICLSVKVHCSPACHWGWGAGNTWAFHKGCLPGSQTCPIALNGECGRLGGSWDSSGHHAPPRGQSCARPLGRGQNQAQWGETRSHTSLRWPDRAMGMGRAEDGTVWQPESCALEWMCLAQVQAQLWYCCNCRSGKGPEWELQLKITSQENEGAALPEAFHHSCLAASP